MATSGPMQLLPPEMLEEIFSYLPYDTLANIRVTCRAFERACCRCLNQGFTRAERCVQGYLKALRSQLPRRESERREHPLSRRVEHLSAVETRLGLLNMTYRRFISTDVCCFIPGKVLDEVFRVLCYLKTAEVVDRSSFAVLQELRDISSMAMEHFDEHIVPRLRAKEQQRTSPSPFSLLQQLAGIASDCEPRQRGCAGRLTDWLLDPVSARGPLRPDPVVAQLTSQLNGQQRALTGHGQRLTQLQQLLTEQRERLAAQDLLIADLTAKMTRLEERLATPVAGRLRSRSIVAGGPAVEEDVRDVPGPSAPQPVRQNRRRNRRPLDGIDGDTVPVAQGDIDDDALLAKRQRKQRHL